MVAAAANPGGDICGRDQLSPQSVASCLWPKQKHTGTPDPPALPNPRMECDKSWDGERCILCLRGGASAVKAKGYETQSPVTPFHLQYLRCVRHTTSSVTKNKPSWQRSKCVFSPEACLLYGDWQSLKKRRFSYKKLIWFFFMASWRSADARFCPAHKSLMAAGRSVSVS